MLLGEKGFFGCNPATLAVFGCATAEEFLSMHPADFSPMSQPDGTDSRTLANRQIATAMEKGRHQFEWMHKRADTGEVFAADVLLSAMELDGKRVFCATVRDITERKRAEELVSKAHAMQRAILDSTSDFIWLVNSKDFRLLTFNRALQDYFLQEYNIRLEVGQRLEDLGLGADYIERWHGYVQRALASGPFTTEHLMASGKVTLLLTFHLLKFNEAIYGVSVFGKDITERKRAEETLRRSETKFRTLFDSTSDALLLSNEQGSFIDCNPAGLAMFGCATVQELCTKHPADLSPPTQPDGTDSLKLAKLQIATALEKGSHHFQWMHKRINASEAFPAEVHLNVMTLGDKRVILGSIRDITERERAVNELRASREQLRALAARVQSVREEERTRVAREIHDVLAQELTHLKIDVSLLARLLAQTPDESELSLVRGKLAAMTTATDIAIQSVQTIATELRPVVLDSLGLCAAIEWMAKDFQAHTGIGCQVRLPRRDLPLDHAHSTALFRILQESLTNVARHAAATRVEVDLQRKAEKVILTIQDNGRGIQESQANAPGAVGLLGMRERALLLGGPL